MDRVTKAVDLFKSGYNCAQSVAGAYADLFGMDENAALRAVEGFGGGIGRMRLTCGAVTGMTFLCGLKYSKGKPGDIETRTLIYNTVRKMAGEFEHMHGSIECGVLLKGIVPKTENARPEDRTEEYYKKRPCISCVRDCAELVEKYLIE